MGQGNTGLGQFGDIFVRTGDDGTIQIAYYKLCTDGTSGWIFIDTPIPDTPLPTPADLSTAALAKAEALVPQPAWHTPADTNPNHHAYAQIPTYFWVDDTTWTPVTARAEFGPIWAQATATPTTLIIDPGDGAPPVRCDFQPPAWTPTSTTDTFAGCEHRYHNSSTLAPNGHAYTVTVSLEWTATWTGSDGTTGNLGTITTTAEPRQLLVAEMQAIITGNG